MYDENKQVIANVVTSEGEIVDKFYEGDSYKKTTKEQNEYLNSHIIHFNEGVRFVKLFDEVLEELSHELTPSEFQFAIRLAKHVSYEDCILRTNGHGNGKILDIIGISELLSENYKTTSRIINGLIKKGILGKHETGCKENPNIKIKCYTCNPYIFMRGININKTTMSMFKDTGWAKISSSIDKEI